MLHWGGYPSYTAPRGGYREHLRRLHEHAVCPQQEDLEYYVLQLTGAKYPEGYSGTSR